jgi:pSer/pThr/pTyr-binding forkhead associated (FHA) protein
MRAQLIPLDGGPPLELTKDLTLVGRKEDCDLRLDHKSVSKQHCILVKSDGVLLVRDLGSTNGTRVNGQRIRRAALLQNEQLSIASLKFRIHIGPGKAPVLPDECTQQLSAPEFADMVDAKAGRSDDSSGEIALEPVRHNALPDAYPNDNRAAKK